MHNRSVRFSCHFLSVLLVIVSAAFASKTAFAGTDQKISFEFALFFAPEPKVDADEKLKLLLTETYSKVLAPTEKEGIVAIVSTKWFSLDDYKLPPAESFQYMTRDVPLTTHAQMAQSKRVLVLSFKALPANIMAANQHTCALMADLADATAGVVWDEECRLFYSAATWRNKRVDSWENGIPDVTGQVNMHAYRDPELVRIITLVCENLACPTSSLTVCLQTTRAQPETPSMPVLNFCSRVTKRKRGCST